MSELLNIELTLPGLMSIVRYLIFAGVICILAVHVLATMGSLAAQIFLCRRGIHHTPDEKSIRVEGINTVSHCKHCGRKIAQDSAGNWFELDYTKNTEE